VLYSFIQGLFRLSRIFEQGIDGQFNLVSMPRYYEGFGSLISAGLHSKTTFADKA
jgi:hypothetical protein